MALTLRCARFSDKAALKRLWDECFHDEKGFTDWFFDERFLPETCAVAESDGEIASVVHGLPVNVRLRDTVLPGIIAAGVATDTRFRGQGLMKKTFTRFMRQARADGFAVVPHRPASLGTFFSIGHFPVSRSSYFSIAAGAPRPEGTLCESVDLMESAPELYACCRRFSKRYSGMAERSWADFVFKLRDYLSCGAKCLVYKENGQITGYCVYFDGDEPYGDEVCALSEQVYRELCRSFAGLFPDRDASLRTEPDAPLPGDFGEIETLEKSVMGAANIALALKASGLSGGAVEVTDRIVPENAGIYDLSGQRTDRPAQLKIPAGRLLQWIAGYKSMAELAQQGYAQVLDPDALRLCDSIGGRPCFIFDEY